VYLHGTARDAQHRRMSKSLGNGIDPLDVVNLYGADALRWTVIAGMGLGSDLLLDHENIEQSFAPGRNFATKLWNIGRFLLLQVGTAAVAPFESLDRTKFQSADHWVINRLADAIAACNSALGPPRPVNGVAWTDIERKLGLRLDEYAEAARKFVWNDFADWYLEACKNRLTATGTDRELARSVLIHTFDQALRLLHPIMPFVTESLWERLPTTKAGDVLVLAGWPAAVERYTVFGGSAAPAFFELRQDIASSLRQVRSEYQIPPTEILRPVLVGPTDLVEATLSDTDFFVRLARAEFAAAGSAAPGGPAVHGTFRGGVGYVLPLAGLVDLTKEREKLDTELGQLQKQLDALRGRLGNEKFTSKAPAAIVDAERAKEREWSARAEQLDSKLRALGGR
jgi:valyl-tRNA synthetase